MREYALTFVIAVAVTYLVTPFVRRAAIAFGAVPPVRDRDMHTEPIPRLGGIAKVTFAAQTSGAGSR